MSSTVMDVILGGIRLGGENRWVPIFGFGSLDFGCFCKTWMFLQSVGHSDLGVNVAAVPREISSCRRAPSERFGKLDDHKPSWFLISVFVPKLTMILRVLEDILC